jgi:hypothetical protein
VDPVSRWHCPPRLQQWRWSYAVSHLAANRNMTFSPHTLLFEPYSHRFFGKRFGRCLPTDGVCSRIVLPNLIIRYAGESTSESIRNGSVTTDHISVILHNADPPHFHFSGLIFESFFSCSIRISSGTYQTKSNTAWCKLSNSFRVGEAESAGRYGFIFVSQARNARQFAISEETRYPYCSTQHLTL